MTYHPPNPQGDSPGDYYQDDYNERRGETRRNPGAPVYDERALTHGQTLDNLDNPLEYDPQARAEAFGSMGMALKNEFRRIRSSGTSGEVFVERSAHNRNSDNAPSIREARLRMSFPSQGRVGEAPTSRSPDRSTRDFQYAQDAELYEDEDAYDDPEEDGTEDDEYYGGGPDGLEDELEDEEDDYDDVQPAPLRARSRDTREDYPDNRRTAQRSGVRPVQRDRSVYPERRRQNSASDIQTKPPARRPAAPTPDYGYSNPPKRTPATSSKQVRQSGYRDTPTTGRTSNRNAVPHTQAQPPRANRPQPSPAKPTQPQAVRPTYPEFLGPDGKIARRPCGNMYYARVRFDPDRPATRVAIECQEERRETSSPYHPHMPHMARIGDPRASSANGFICWFDNDEAPQTT